MTTEETTAKLATSMRKQDAILLSLFVGLTGVREVVAEHFMKSTVGASPATIILHFVLSAVMLAPFIRAHGQRAGQPFRRSSLGDLLLLNIATAVTYALTYIAVWSDLGAAYTNLLDYGLTPVFGFVFAWVMLKERIQSWRLLVVTLSLVGLTLLFLCDVDKGHRAGPTARWGLLAVAGASSCGAWMYALNKRLVVNKTPEWLILAGRMPLTIAGCLLILAHTGNVTEPTRHLYLFPFALLFYALPMYLVLVVFKTVSFGSFSLWLFLIPCVTLIAASFSGYANFNTGRILGVSLVFLPVIIDQVYSYYTSRNSQPNRTSDC